VVNVASFRNRVLVRFMRNQTMNWCNRLGLGLVLTGLLAIQPAQGQATSTLATTRPANNAPASQPDDDYINEFGVESSQPYTDVFFFRFGRYIDTPIVVERRGLSVYINNQRVVRKSDSYPPRDLRVTVDPGEPPADKSPWEAANPEKPEDWYWLKKWRYLCGQREYQESLQALAEVFRRSRGVTNVDILDEDKTNQIVKLRVTADGSTYNLVYSKTGYLKVREAPDKVAAAQRELESSRSYYRSFCRDMARGGFWFNFGLADTIVSERIGVEVIHVLESNLTWDEKMTQLEQRKLSGAGALNMFNRMKDTYISSPQLLRRIEDLEAKWAQPNITQSIVVSTAPSVPKSPPATTTAPWTNKMVTPSPRVNFRLGIEFWLFGVVGVVLCLTGIYIWLRKRTPSK